MSPPTAPEGAAPEPLPDDQTRADEARSDAAVADEALGGLTESAMAPAADAPEQGPPDAGPADEGEPPDEGAAALADAAMDTAPVCLAVEHDTRYRYDTPVEVALHSAHLRPRDTEVQRVLDWQLDIEPPPDGAVQQSLDAFGNWRHGFGHAQVHATLLVRSSFRVCLHPPRPWRAADSLPCEAVVRALLYAAGEQQPEAVEYMLASRFAPHDARLAAFAADLFTPQRPLLEAALALMHRVHQRMRYRPLSTDVATDAPSALARGEGVCQDFAHLMIGAMRSLGLAARYVSGYLLTHPPEGQPRLVGADASHAWVAVWCPRQGWVALDPTNNCRVGTDHVTLAWGRDYGDVAPLRGVIRGGGSTPPDVAVTVMPLPAAAAGA
ncbi:transglutaminase family protein [Aquabacterium sp. OR-4]|uniref:transglutaminase family protein n=1 Tax=Aquabacterium sp. OR-4 TaxID=2978127 RepID=UPI0021B49899|nr:transglutaminase family protein [Aquabacterium sp. OR-4]MDT7835219.1 transglutaminase family protein [Aquabacterium sp. OR-4]